MISGSNTSSQYLIRQMEKLATIHKYKIKYDVNFKGDKEIVI